MIAVFSMTLAGFGIIKRDAALNFLWQCSGALLGASSALQSKPKRCTKSQKPCRPLAAASSPSKKRRVSSPSMYHPSSPGLTARYLMHRYAMIRQFPREVCMSPDALTPYGRSAVLVTAPTMRCRSVWRTSALRQPSASRRAASAFAKAWMLASKLVMSTPTA